MEKISIYLLILFFIACFSGCFNPFEKSKKVPRNIILSDANEIIVVSKKKQKLYFYEKKGGKFTLLKTFDCSTGKEEGRKQIEGDKKTPEGIYFFIKEYKERELSDIYGAKAYVMDYPNFFDKLDNRSGSAIWLHGIDKILKKRNSNGCVALKNRDLKFLSKKIHLFKTPIIIVEDVKLTYASTQKSLKRKIKSFILNYMKNLKTNTSFEIVSIYKFQNDYVATIKEEGDKPQKPRKLFIRKTQETFEVLN